MKNCKGSLREPSSCNSHCRSSRLPSSLLGGGPNPSATGAAVERSSIHPLLPTQPDFIRMCDAPRSIRDVVDVADAKFTLLREFAHRRAEKLVELGADLDPRVTDVSNQDIRSLFHH